MAVIYDCATGEAVIVADPSPHDLPLEDRRAAMIAALAETRWQHEVGGTVFNGTPLATDRETTAILTAAYVKAKEDAGYTIRWKTGAGTFVTLDAATIIAIADAARGHVQACFDREDVLTSAIVAAGNHGDLDAIDIGVGWPGGV